MGSSSHAIVTVFGESWHFCDFFALNMAQTSQATAEIQLPKDPELDTFSREINLLYFSRIPLAQSPIARRIFHFCSFPQTTS